MLALIIYEIRSHWNSILVLLSFLMIWDLLLFYNISQLSLLHHTILFLTWIGFSVIYVTIHAFIFSTDFINKNTFFISQAPNQIWKIILSKLIPIWIVYIFLGFLHSIFMLFSRISFSNNINIGASLSKYFFQLFSFHVFLFILITSILLFLWIVILQTRILFQKTVNNAWSFLLILAVIGCFLLFILRNFLIRGLSTNDPLGSVFITFPYFLIIAFLFLAIFLFWVVWFLWHQYTDL